LVFQAEGLALVSVHSQNQFALTKARAVFVDFVPEDPV